MIKSGYGNTSLCFFNLLWQHVRLIWSHQGYLGGRQSCQNMNHMVLPNSFDMPWLVVEIIFKTSFSFYRVVQLRKVNNPLALPKVVSITVFIYR